MGMIVGAVYGCLHSTLFQPQLQGVKDHLVMLRELREFYCTTVLYKRYGSHLTFEALGRN